MAPCYDTATSHSLAEDQQQPIMLGTVGGIPQTKSGSRAADDSNDSILPTEGGGLVDGSFVGLPAEKIYDLLDSEKKGTKKRHRHAPASIVK